MAGVKTFSVIKVNSDESLAGDRLFNVNFIKSVFDASDGVHIHYNKTGTTGVAYDDYVVSDDFATVLEIYGAYSQNYLDCSVYDENNTGLSSKAIKIGSRDIIGGIDIDDSNSVLYVLSNRKIKKVTTDKLISEIFSEIGDGFDVDEVVAAHVSRVEADGGVVESEAVLKQVLTELKDTYSILDEDDFNSKLLATYDPAVFGYKVGTGEFATLGKAAEKLYSISSTKDLEQTTLANQPVLLRHNDTDGNYVYLSRDGISGEAIQTVNNPGLTYTPSTDTMVMTCKIQMSNQVATTEDSIFYSTGWSLRYRNRGIAKSLQLLGSTFVTSSNYTPIADSVHWVRCTVTPTAVGFEWSQSGTSWTTIDTGLTPPTFTGANGVVYVGYLASRENNACNIYYAEVDNQTTGNNIILDMNDYDPDVSDIQITSSYADATVWNIERSPGNNGVPMVLVDRSKVAGDGVAYTMSGTFTISQEYTMYALARMNYNGPLVGMAASSFLGHDGTNIELDNGTALTIADALRNRNFITAEANGASSKIRLDDGVDTEGDAGANDGTYLSLFANGATYGIGSLEMLIISTEADSDTIKQSMYNYFG